MDRFTDDGGTAHYIMVGGPSNYRVVNSNNGLELNENNLGFIGYHVDALDNGVILIAGTKEIRILNSDFTLGEEIEDIGFTIKCTEKLPNNKLFIAGGNGKWAILQSDLTIEQRGVWDDGSLDIDAATYSGDNEVVVGGGPYWQRIKLNQKPQIVTSIAKKPILSEDGYFGKAAA